MGLHRLYAPERARAWVAERYPALAAPAYRRLAVSVGLTEFALFVFEVALAWLILEATGSSALVGLLYAVLMAPIVVLIVPGGLLGDRSGPRPVMLFSVAGAGATIAVAALVVASGQVAVPFAFVLTAAVGTFVAFWIAPAQVMASRVVEQRNVPSAIGFTALPTGLGSIAGGAVGGIALEVGGARLAFAIAAVSLAGSAIGVWGLPHLPGAASGGRILATELLGTIAWMGRRPHVLALLMLGALGAVFFMSRIALYPGLVDDVLRRGPSGLGLLVSAGGVGWVAASLAADRIGGRLGRGSTLLVSLAAAGVGLAVLGLSTWLTLSIVVAALASTCFVIHQVTAMTVLQLATPAGMRGRVVSVFMLTRAALFPLGTLTIGFLADGFGVTLTFLAFGLATVTATGAAAAWLRGVDVDAEGELVGAPPMRAADPEGHA